jgi:hypothetical protein
MNRKTLVVLAVLTVLVATAIASTLIVRSNLVTEAKFRRLNEGMTEAEVSGVFGISPRHGALAPAVLEWNGRAGSAVIVFDDSGKLIEKSWIPHPPETWGDACKRFLRGISDFLVIVRQ